MTTPDKKPETPSNQEKTIKQQQYSKFKTKKTKLWKYIIPLLLILLPLPFLPALFTQNYYCDIDFSKTGQIGDTIGGITTPFIAVAASILTFIAFWEQFKANTQQKDDLQVERFENKFYQLLEIHRNNINETTINGEINGRKAYISMFNELKFTYLSTLIYYHRMHMPITKEEKSDDLLYNIAYLIFFFGIGENSSKMIQDLLGDQHKTFLTGFEEHLKKAQGNWKTEKIIAVEESILAPDITPKASEDIPENNDEKTENKSYDDLIADKGVFTLEISYIPFNGHMSRLSHYIRNLFQLVKFIDKQSDEIFSYEDKYLYASTLRSQLSNHEQLLLYYNALSVLGQAWEIDNKEGLLQKYCVIRSMPLPLADFHKLPTTILTEKNLMGKYMFEWHEIKDRIKSLNQQK